MPRTELDYGQRLEHLSILDERGAVDDALDPGFANDELLRLYRAMVLTRQLDIRMLRMQRQGQMGTFAPGRGQEATQIGSIRALRKSDWYWPSYRSFGAQMWRGWTVEGLMLLWDGYFAGFEIPEGTNELPFSIIVGGHIAPATGIAMACRYEGTDEVVLTNFGDGATSQGDFAEAVNFAGVYKSPIVYLCENNQWAISTPFEKQTASKSIAHRALGFGVEGIQVDGNDILAVSVAVEEAVARARAGEGPTVIEALTYRMDVHTTADDPTVYRKDDEVERWEAKDPIIRFEKYLRDRGALDDAAIEAIESEERARVDAGRKLFDELKQKDYREVFDYVYATLPPELQEQRADYFAKLDRAGL